MRSGLIAVRAAGAATVLVLASPVAAASVCGHVQPVGGSVQVAVRDEATPTQTHSPSDVPTNQFTQQPSSVPTQLSSNLPTHLPTQLPTRTATPTPTAVPTQLPTSQPAGTPASQPTGAAATQPTGAAASQPASAAASRPAQQETPVAPVRAGGGGTAPLAVEEVHTQDAGPGTPHTIVGLVLAGIAAVAVAMRTSRRRRRPDTE